MRLLRLGPLITKSESLQFAGELHVYISCVISHLRTIGGTNFACPSLPLFRGRNVCAYYSAYRCYTKTSRKLDNVIFEDTHFSLTQNPFSGKADFYGNGTCHVIMVSFWLDLRVAIKLVSEVYLIYCKALN